MMKKQTSFKVGALFLVLAAGSVGSWFAFSKNAQVVHCVGADPKTGTLHKLVLSDASGEMASASHLSLSGNNWKLEDQDVEALIKVSEGGATVTMKLDKTRHLQVLKICGNEPRCEFRRYEVPDLETIQSEKKTQTQAERQAFELRREADRLTRELNQARERVEKAANAKEARQAKQIADEIIARYFAVSAAAHEATRRASELRMTASLNRVEFKSTEFVPHESSSWCGWSR